MLFFLSGLKWLTLMTAHKRYQLRIYLADAGGRTRYATYSTFSVGPSPNYTLIVGGHSGNIGTTVYW